jgi:hypothetical protein
MCPRRLLKFDIAEMATSTFVGRDHRYLFIGEPRLLKPSDRLVRFLDTGKDAGSDGLRQSFCDG